MRASDLTIRCLLLAAFTVPLSAVSAAPPQENPKILFSCTLGRWEEVRLVELPGRKKQYVFRVIVSWKNGSEKQNPIFAFIPTQDAIVTPDRIHLVRKATSGSIEIIGGHLPETYSPDLPHLIDSGDWLVEVRGRGDEFAALRKKLKEAWLKYAGSLDGIDPLKMHGNRPEKMSPAPL